MLESILAIVGTVAVAVWRSRRKETRLQMERAGAVRERLHEGLSLNETGRGPCKDSATRRYHTQTIGTQS